MYPDSSRRAFCERLTGAILTMLLANRAEGRESDKDKSNTAGDKVYEPGGDVKPPKLVHYVEPSFSPKSKEAFVEGIVRISTVVSTDGVPKDFRVISGVNAEEDRNAIEALKQWKFQPGTRNGQPVNVRVTVEVEFHLL